MAYDSNEDFGDLAAPEKIDEDFPAWSDVKNYWAQVAKIEEIENANKPKEVVIKSNGEKKSTKAIGKKTTVLKDGNAQNLKGQGAKQ